MNKIKRCAVTVLIATSVPMACAADSIPVSRSTSSAEITTLPPGDDHDDGDDVTLPVTVNDFTGAEVTIRSIERIVPVDGDLAEIVFALGLGDHVVAVDISATYPAAVNDLPRIGYQRALSPEPIAAVEPTIVLATDLAEPDETLEQVRRLGIPVVVIERELTIEGSIRKVQAVAQVLGVPERGAAIAASMQAEISSAKARRNAVTSAPRVVVLYVRGESLQLILGTGTGVDALLSAVGAVDVAAELGIVDTRPVTAEALVVAAPDVVVLTTSGLASVGGIDGLLQLPGIAGTPAGANRRILTYEDQFLLGGGPRIGQLVDQMLDDLHPELP